MDTSHFGGIPEAEVSELKVFLKDVIPFLPAALQAAELLQRGLERTVSLKRQEAAEVFTPTIQLTKIFGDDVRYHLRFTWDGIIFLDREDSVKATAGELTEMESSVARIYRPVGELARVESEK